MPDHTPNGTQRGSPAAPQARRAKTAPVFVDRSGQRLRRVRVTAWSGTSLVVIAFSVVVAGLLGGMAGTPGGWSRPEPVPTSTPSATAAPASSASQAPNVLVGSLVSTTESARTTSAAAPPTPSEPSAVAPNSASATPSETPLASTPAAAPVGSAHATRKPTAPPGKP